MQPPRFPRLPANHVGREHIRDGRPVATTKYSSNPPIAVAASGRLLKLHVVDREQIERFITDSLRKEPEDVPMQGV